MAKIAVLASGTGSLFEAMPEHGLKPSLLIVDRPCRAFEEVAPKLGVPSMLVDRRDYGFKPRVPWQRHRFTEDIVSVLEQTGIELVLMAGFMTLFTEEMFRMSTFAGRVLNSHPALLPAFPGDSAVQDALDYGVKLTGCTIHLAVLPMDAGPILEQEAVSVLSTDDVFSLHERIKQVERRLYPEVALRYLEDHDRLRQMAIAVAEQSDTTTRR